MRRPGQVLKDPTLSLKSSLLLNRLDHDKHEVFIPNYVSSTIVSQMQTYSTSDSHIVKSGMK